VVEAKKQETTLGGVSEETAKYQVNFPEQIPHVELPLPFGYESNAQVTHFADRRDPDFRSRKVFAFHQPETLREWLGQKQTLRARLKNLPPLDTSGLWAAQVEAINNLEKSLAENRPRALIQMATGSGKTFTAISFIYRLIKFAKAKRILFLVDRNNLARQAQREFQAYITPDDGRKFTELYNVQHLTSPNIDRVSKVTITTIQRLYSILKGEPLEDELEEHSLYEVAPPDSGPPRTVEYNPQVPIETFDFIITDECHRSIYHLWRQVLEYFDAFLIGLTATPSRYTLGFFNNNLVTEYSHERAVADGVNVGYEVYSIRTRITQEGSRVEARHYVDRRDKKSHAERWAVELDEDLEYTANQLDREVVSKDQIRTVVRAFKENLFTEIFPGRQEVPKTLVFAKDDSHAEDIVEIIRQEFGRGNDFCKKITYKTFGESPEDLIKAFRTSYNPRIAVTVDMISTGTDIKPLECLLFMRMIKSQTYFEQMKGRGTRVISPDDLQVVSQDAGTKTHFVIIDAVGVCEEDKTDTRPLERKRHVPFDKLLLQIAQGVRDDDTLSSLAGRLARLQSSLKPADLEQVQQVSGGEALQDLTHALLDTLDPDVQTRRACQDFQTEQPTPEQVDQAKAELVKGACAPFDNPALRETLTTLRRRDEQIIDLISQDEVLGVGFDPQAAEGARQAIESFQQFIQDNKDELLALQIFYNQPYAARGLTYQMIKELAEAIQQPPYSLTTEKLWHAYRQLQGDKVRSAGPQRLLTDIISLVRFALGECEVLEPFPLTVEERYKNWLVEQMQAGRQFSDEQLAWLEMIKDHIAASLTIEMEDFEYEPFVQKGGLIRIDKLFQPDLDKILEELRQVLV